MNVSGSRSMIFRLADELCDTDEIRSVTYKEKSPLDLASKRRGVPAGRGP